LEINFSTWIQKHIAFNSLLACLLLYALVGNLTAPILSDLFRILVFSRASFFPRALLHIEKYVLAAAACTLNHEAAAVLPIFRPFNLHNGSYTFQDQHFSSRPVVSELLK
jgi:hypothetical protein